MKNILVTGYNGFIGKNLMERLKRLENTNIFTFGKEHDLSELQEYIKKADFIYHLAGANRPKENKDFLKVNTDLTQSIIDIIKKEKRYIPILITSSIQSRLDNLYGVSKRKAEEIVLKYSEECDVNVFVYRLPNVFGKWSKPNYNSAVATFCHNISRNLDIHITDPNKELELVYIDDVINSFISKLYKNEKTYEKYNEVNPIYKTTIKNLVDNLYKIKNGVNNLIMPNLKDDFIKALHATYLSFLDKDDFSYELKEHKDIRGSFVEIMKSSECGQISVSTTKGKLIRGNHYHNTKNEKICVIKGSALIRFRDFYGNEIIEYYVSDKKIEVVNIPPGYTHNIENLSDDELILIIWANEMFDEKNPDTYYCEV